MRNILFIVVHCTATKQDTTLQSIFNYWKNVKKWKVRGYHYMITADGKIYNTAPEESITNGVKGNNEKSIHISYIGGIDEKNNPKDNRTPEQKVSLRQLLQKLKYKYPKAMICGHKDFPKVYKACPSFNAMLEYSDITGY